MKCDFKRWHLNEPAGPFCREFGLRSKSLVVAEMLQDLERGRPMEIDALVSAVQELGRLTGQPTPTIDSVLALVRRLGNERGCY